LPANHWKADAVLWFVCWVLVACAGLSAAFVAVARGLEPHPEAWKIVANQLALQLPIILGAHFFLGFHGTDWTSGFGLRRVPRAWLLGIGAGLAAVLVGYPLQFAAAKTIEWLGGHPDTQEAVRIIARANSTQRFLIAIVAIAGAALAEEILFRGILYAAVRDAGFPRLALWGTAIFFGAIHANLAAFVPLALFGAVLALLYDRTGNLGACIAAHATFNVVGFLTAVFSGLGA
jgi:membrane protease YdiL (CAAX protease family)